MSATGTISPVEPFDSRVIERQHTTLELPHKTQVLTGNNGREADVIKLITGNYEAEAESFLSLVL